MYPSIQKYSGRNLSRRSKITHAEIAEEMRVCGLMNMQYAIEDGKVYVLEANPTSFPYGATWYPKYAISSMVPLATQIMTSELTGSPSPIARIEGAVNSIILWCEGSRIPIQYVPGSRPGPRTGNAFYRRSSRTFGKCRRSLLIRHRKRHRQDFRRKEMC